jgi:hypothetical protein
MLVQMKVLATLRTATCHFRPKRKEDQNLLGTRFVVLRELMSGEF